MGLNVDYACKPFGVSQYLRVGATHSTQCHVLEIEEYVEICM